MAVRMSDVARAAGVSPMTVSNVINGHPNVRAETRLRVLACIAELGYQVNLAARYLRAGKTGAIGLVVPELDRPYFGQLASRLADGVERSGRHLMLERTGASREGELAAVSLGRLRMYDGVIVSVVGMNVSDLEQLSITTPMVLVGERAGPSSFDHVMMDNVGGAEVATRHLLATGARRIVLLGGRHSHRGVDMQSLRTRGYRKAHETAGAAVDERLVVPVESFDLPSGRETILQLAEAGVPFDAVFALTDVIAMGALRGLADLGLDVPRDVQIVGFDDIAECEYLVPRLTSVDPGNEATAETILGLLERRMVQNAGSDLTGDIERVKKIMPAKLVLRGSTRPLSGQGARAHERLLFETAGCSDTSRLPSMRVAAGSGASRTDSQRDARAHLRRDRRPSGPNEDACNRDARRSEPRTGCRAGLADDAQTSPRLSRPGEECGLEVAGLAVRGSPGPLAGRRSP